LEGTYKSIAALGDGLNEAGLLRGIAQSFPQPGNRTVQAMIEVDKCVGRPKFFTELFPRNHFTGSLQQQKQNTERLFL